MCIYRALALLPILGVVLPGCSKPNPEEIVPGTWKHADGKLSATFKSDKTFSEDIGQHQTIEGTWKIDNGDVVMTPVTMSGMPVEDVKADEQKLLEGQPPNPNRQKVIDDLDKPNILSIDPDGKTMSTDKTRDKNSGPGDMLTKQGS